MWQRDQGKKTRYCCSAGWLGYLQKQWTMLSGCVKGYQDVQNVILRRNGLKKIRALIKNQNHVNDYFILE